MEVVTEGQTTSEHTNNYEISEQFSYSDGDLNVINDNGDDNDTYQNEGDDSDVVDDVTDAINDNKKSLNVKRFLRDKLFLLRLYKILKILTTDMQQKLIMTK